MQRQLPVQNPARVSPQCLWTHTLAAVLVVGVVTLPVLLRAQGTGSGQTPPKSALPPSPKKGDLPPAKSAPPAKPAAKADAAAPSPAAVPQGPIVNDDDPRVKAALQRAAVFLRKTGMSNNVGRLALVVHALAKVHEKYPDIVPAGDPAFQQLVEMLRAACTPTFKPTSSGGPDNYEAGCVAMALAAADGQGFKQEISNVAQYILGKQFPNGGWGYLGRPGGDTSQTQYSILGLWEAGAAAGINIPKDRWDKAAQWLLKTQHSDGGFEYNPPEPSPGAPSAREATHTMTVASLGSLYISRDHLPFGKRKNSRGVLLPVQEEELKDVAFKPTVAEDQMKQAIEKASDWLQKHFTLNKAVGESDSGGGRWFFYYLYAFERFATLANLKEINGVDWYAEGARLILARQQTDGSWNEGDGSDVNTAFGVLFLVRSTKVSMRIHERRLGRGTLVSGRLLPTNLADMEQKNGQLKAAAIKGSTGQLLGTIESGLPTQAEGAAIGLLKEMYTKKWTAGGEEGDRLKKMYEKGVATKSSEVIKAAMKLLAVTGDYKVVPILIDGMYYDDDSEVQLAARQALCMISRKFNGFGLIYPEEATREEWEEEIERWKVWYRSVRPEAALEDDVDIIK